MEYKYNSSCLLRTHVLSPWAFTDGKNGVDISVGRSRKTCGLRIPWLILPLATQHPVCPLRSQIAGIIRRQLLVLLYINVRLVIKPKSDRELRNTHDMVMSEGSELNGVNTVKTVVRLIELKRNQHL